MRTSDHIKAQITDRRLELGLSRQSDAARAAGISTTTWQIMEGRGEVPKSPRLQYQVTRALQWPPDAFRRMSRGEPPMATPAAPADPADQRVQELIEAFEAGRAEDREWFAQQLSNLRVALRRAVKEQQQ